ncbi:hypothetical protein PPACK8108_LOCUS11166 [Phakopsora pachyrhizi]|uniref:Uncharacterized protein n=1 Tax=Phakopsora pachyrhizi TaxID=170000 RepID=A0AAV0AZL2_PHAPC|nr:hypothetical protein PPACK8108_LOCUS11166 [Phakopsora pachyrhizi]
MQIPKMRVKLCLFKFVIGLATFSRAGRYDFKTAFLLVNDYEPSFLQSSEQRLQHWNSEVESSNSPAANLFPGESDCIPLVNQQQRGEKRIREDAIIDSDVNDSEFHLDLCLGISQPENIKVDNQLSERKRLRPTIRNFEHGLKPPGVSFASAINEPAPPLDLHLGLSQAPIAQVDDQLSERKRLRPTSHAFEHGLKPTGLNFDSAINEPAPLLDLHLGLSQPENIKVDNQVSERKRLRPTIRNFEHGLKTPGINFDSDTNEPLPLLDLRLGLSQAQIAQVDNQLSKRKRLGPTSLTFDQGLKLPDISSISLVKSQEADNKYVYAMRNFFLQDYEKNYFDNSKGSFVSPYKNMRTGRWIYSPAAEDQSIVDRSLRENSKSVHKTNEGSASKSELFRKLQDNSSDAGNENQNIAFASLEKASKTVSGSIERSSSSEIFDKLKNQWVNTGSSSRKNVPKENSPTLSLLSPFEENYSKAMSLAKSLFQKHSQLGSIDFKIFLKSMIDKKNSKTIKRVNVDLDLWRYFLSKASRSYNMIVENIDVRKLYNSEIKNLDILYVKGKEVLPLSESIKSDKFEKFYLDASTPKSSVDLTILKDYVYHDHEFDQIVALENLDNYVESVFKRIRNRAFRTELIFGSMINLTSNSEKDTKMIRKHKVKAWGQYLTRSRLKVLPPYYGYEITPYMMVTEEIGYQMGIRRLKDLKIYKKIKMHKRRLEKLPNLQCEISKRSNRKLKSKLPGMCKEFILSLGSNHSNRVSS